MSSNTALDYGLTVHSAALNGLSETQTVLTFKEILDSVPEICFAVSTGGEHFTYLNTSAATILGYQLSELMCMSVKAVVSPSSLANVCDIIHKCAASQHNENYRVMCPPMYIELLRKNRMLIRGTAYCSLQLSPENVIISISGMIHIKEAALSEPVAATTNLTAVPDAGKVSVETTSIPSIVSASPVKENVTPGKIIIMDDEEILTDIAVQMGKRLGLAVETAKNGTDAITLYKNALTEGAPFDAVLLDMTISGGMGGVEASKELHKIDPNVKTIVMSGYSDHEVMAKPADYGFCGVISKPFRLNEFSQILHSVIPIEKFRGGKA